METRENLPGWGPPRSLLALHDLTQGADHAAWRAGMIARDHGARLCLLHAARDAVRLVRARRVLERLADEISGHLGVPTTIQVVHDDPMSAVVRARHGTCMVVLGAQRSNVLRDWVLGTPAERLIRLCGRPVLVVKKPARASYQRVLVPVDFGAEALPAIAAAATLSRSAQVEVFHSLRIRDDVTMRAAEVPEVEMRRHRQRRAERARARIEELIGTVPRASLAAAPSIAFGHAPSMVLAKEQAMRADLVVIGKRRRGLLADFLLGSVTQHVLSAGRSDVLVLAMARNELRPAPMRSRLPA